MWLNLLRTEMLGAMKMAGKEKEKFPQDKRLEHVRCQRPQYHLKQYQKTPLSITSLNPQILSKQTK
jgi:hypothetical protein